MGAQPGSNIQVPLNATLALRRDILIVPQQLGAQPCYVVEDLLRSKFYRIGVREFTFISLLDGKTTLGDALGLAATILGQDALSEQDALILGGWLIDCQLANHGSTPALNNGATSGDCRPTELLANLRDPFFIKLPLFNPDPLLARLLPWCGGLLGRWFLGLWIVLCTAGMYTACAEWRNLLTSSCVILDRSNWFRLIAAWFCLSLWHEAFHALACKKYGGTVPRAGLALLFFVPAAFVDVTSSWRFGSRRQRIITAAAGIYAELFVAAVALIVWAHTPEGLLHRFCYDLTFMASLTTLLVNGNPLLRFDGYYILSDLIEIPNLASQGRQYIGYLCQRYFWGRDVSLPIAIPDRSAILFRVYAVASVSWRVFLMMTLILTVIRLFSYLGIIAAILFVAFGVALPIVRQAIGTFRRGLPPGRTSLQWAMVAACAAAILSLFTWWLAGPGTIRARAIVEYAPLTVVRAASPGFVSQVLVVDGQSVQAGQVMVVLVNDELQLKLAELELTAQQKLIRGRTYYQEQDLPKFQIETFEFQSLEKQKAEAAREVAALMICAPTSGHVVGRKLATLAGQFLEAGAEIAVVGNEEAKELLVAVPQEDVDPFTSHIGQNVSVRVWGAAHGDFQSTLSKVDPRAVLDCPHPALSAQAGGPLPVKASPVGGSSKEPSAHWQLLTPIFTGRVPLSGAESLRWNSGQLTTVSFQSAMESRWRRLARWASNWIDRRLEAGPANKAS